MSEDHLSPDGLYNLTLSIYAMRMSHWVQSPELYHVQTGAKIFGAPSLWSADAVKWSPDSASVHLSMRLYPGSKPGVEVWLYPATEQGKVQVNQPAEAKEPARIITGSFAEILQFLDTY